MIKVLVLLGLSLVSAGLMLSFKKRHCSTSALKASFHDYHICQCAKCIDLIEHICHEIGCEEILLDEELCSHCGIRYCCEHIRSHEQLCAYFQPVVDARSATLACLADLADRGLLSQSIQDESSQYRLALSLARAELHDQRQTYTNYDRDTHKMKHSFVIKHVLTYSPNLPC